MSNKRSNRLPLERRDSTRADNAIGWFHGVKELVTASRPYMFHEIQMPGRVSWSMPLEYKFGADPVDVAEAIGEAIIEAARLVREWNTEMGR